MKEDGDGQKKRDPGGKWSLFGIFGKKEEKSEVGGNQPVRAKLGEESSFYFDPVTKKWVNKKVGATTEDKKELMPPPSGSFVSLNSAPALSDGQSKPPLMHNLSNQSLNRIGSKRGARNKYVDVMNPDSTNNSNSSSISSFLPKPTLDIN